MARKPALKTLRYGQGSIAADPRKPGAFVLRHVIDGHRYIERGATVAEVEARRDARRGELGQRAKLTGGGLDPVTAVADAWLAWKIEAHSPMPATVAAYRWAMGHVAIHFGAITIGELSAADLEAGFARMHTEGLSAVSVKKVRRALSLVLKFAVRRHYRSGNPLELVEMPREAKAREAKVYFDLDEYARVVPYLIGHHSTRHAVLLTILHTGMRPGEARGLRWEAVDFEAGTITVATAVHRDRANATSYVDATLKTDHASDKGHRVIPMTAEVAAELRKERAEQLARGRQPFVFTTARGELVPETSLRHTAVAVAKAAEVGYVRPHGYRHTFTSVCRHRGMAYEVLAKLLGHVNASQIIATYGHPMVDPAKLDLGRYVGMA